MVQAREEELIAARSLRPKEPWCGTIWVVSELYYPEETSTGYYMTRIAEGLAQHHGVRVLCGQPNYLARGLRAPRQETHNGVAIHRCAGTTLDKNVLAYRLLNMLTLSLSIFAKAVSRFARGDDVLVVTTPPSLPFVVAAACRLRGARYTLLIHDNYPEILIAVKKLDPATAPVRFLNWMNRKLFSRASLVIVVGRDMKELVTRKSALPTARITIIPNWAELELVEPRPREQNALLDRLGLQDKIVLLYAGNLGHPNDVETIVECAARLKNDARFHFLFIGAGVKKSWLEESVRGLSLHNVTSLGPRPRAEQVEFLNACDIALVTLVGGMWGVSMPSRTYNVLASGKPIIALAEPGSELAMVVEEDAVGWVVRPHDSDALLKTLLDAAADPAVLHAMGGRARQSALEKYGMRQAVEKYLDVLPTGQG